MVYLKSVLLDLAIGPQITESDAVIIIIGAGAVIAAVAAVLVIRAARKRKKDGQDIQR